MINRNKDAGSDHPYLSPNQPKNMKTFALFLSLLILNSYFLFAQTDEKLKSDIRNTGYVHSPLPLDYSKSFETYGLTKKILAL